MRVENQPVICSVKIYSGEDEPTRSWPPCGSPSQDLSHILAGLQDDQWIPRILDPTCPGQSLVIDFVETWEWNETYPPENSRLDHLKTHPIAKENHLPSTSFLGSMLIFQGFPDDSSRPCYMSLILRCFDITVIGAQNMMVQPCGSTNQYWNLWNLPTSSSFVLFPHILDLTPTQDAIRTWDISPLNWKKTPEIQPNLTFIFVLVCFSWPSSPHVQELAARGRLVALERRQKLKCLGAKRFDHCGWCRNPKQPPFGCIKPYNIMG